mmetsp:Transcript_11708/g.15904  ORF Transcript_11708/g.15904 Transcript_11708/m.15904 type:complete len:168 (+) Transcript_11708:138-641(+)|eukprot:CAMPEP_0196579886 /NCGR_PEP_ID=MMETSP1081-20130531/25504_1 /TAXON_ID=36882 /ORGANISM="Pyramimonas amylifera, Strain CCMP720" /LENGTH=167 /DNA_ID=CAMNT_0041899599 /DNA_START=134 /DNA_END=637 /DNA_ORIENTATION=-
MASYLILLRHGNAVPAEVDPERPLDVAGEFQASTTGVEIAATCKGYKITDIKILHSKKLRAKQTAKIVEKELALVKFGTSVSSSEGLNPNDPVPALVKLIKASQPAPNDALMLVGHLPQLGLLAAELGFDALGEEDFPVAGGLLIKYPANDEEEEEWELLRQFQGDV